jgi:rubrerythrin
MSTFFQVSSTKEFSGFTTTFDVDSDRYDSLETIIHKVKQRLVKAFPNKKKEVYNSKFCIHSHGLEELLDNREKGTVWICDHCG